MRAVSDALPRVEAEAMREKFVGAHFHEVGQRHPERYQASMRFDSADLPDSDEIYTARFGRSRQLEVDSAEMCEEFIRPLIESEIGASLGKIKLRAYRMQAGDHFRAHRDDYFCAASFAYYLSHGWRWDWGGLLIGIEDGFAKSFLPRFNDLVIMMPNIPHFVTEIAPWAREPRYMLGGFCEAAA